VPASVGSGPALARFTRGIGQELGRILSWALSFYVVARVWIGHHTLFRYLRRIDQRLMGLNLLFLALVAFLPYATAVLGDWGDTAPGAAFYAASMAAVGLTQSGLWFHARRARLTSPELTPALAKAQLLTILTFPAVFLVPVPVAFLSPAAAQGHVGRGRPYPQLRPPPHPGRPRPFPPRRHLTHMLPCGPRRRLWYHAEGAAWRGAT
jgi:uncharacterized membrane protein